MRDDAAQRHRLLRLPADDKKARREARRDFVESMTLREYVSRITPDSRKWLAQFFDNTRRRGTESFDVFYSWYQDRTLAEIKALVRSRGESVRASKHEETTQPILSACAPTAEPNTTSGLAGSKLVRKRTYNCQKRYIVSTSQQLLAYRGRNDQTASPYFPDYGNVYCDACCGPAAAQSILEWYNVPVRWANGSPATGTHNIQHRLANLMDTTDGVDYTHPDDLAGTLMRSEFVGNKGYCYMPGDGSLTDVRYMLSAGTPVILLLAEDDWAHFVTLFGFDQDANKFYVANSLTDYSPERLRDLWEFDNLDWYYDALFHTAGVSSNTLFSYSPSGCDQAWAYKLDHTNANPEVSDRAALYFEEFNEQYVANRNENGMRLNFIGAYGFDITFSLSFNDMSYTATPVTNVGYVGQVVALGGGNTHIITRTSHPSGIVPNNSQGRAVGIEVQVDKQFLNANPELHAGFIVRKADGSVAAERYGRYTANLDVAASNVNTHNYVYRLDVNYQPAMASVDFVIHGGLRKMTWALAGCFRDMDGDGRCDEFDDDTDGDGVPNSSDNCADVANPGQEATIEPDGLGDACWRPSGPVVEWGKGLLPDERMPAILEQMMGHKSPDPCNCRGLCFSCPAEFAMHAAVLKRFAVQRASGRVPPRSFIDQLDEFVSGFRYQASNVRVNQSRLLRDGTPRVQMEVTASKNGYISVRVPDVILDRRGLFGAVKPLSVTVDGDKIEAYEQETAGVRVLSFAVPRNARMVEISGNRSSFH